MRTDLDIHNGPVGLGYIQGGDISKQHRFTTGLDVCQVSMQGTLGETNLFGHHSGIGDLAILRHDLADEDRMRIPYPRANEGVGKREAHTLRPLGQEGYTCSTRDPPSAMSSGWSQCSVRPT